MIEGYYEITYRHGLAKESIVIKARNKIEALEIAKSKVSGQIVKVSQVNKPLEIFAIFDSLKNSFLIKSAKVDPNAYIFAVRQISVMANAGISFTEILKEAAKGSNDKVLSKILSRAISDVNAGQSFSGSLKKYESQIGRLGIIMADLGEKTGAMAEAMNSLAIMLEENSQNRQKLKKAIRYPIMTLISMVAAFTILIVFVVPKFKTIFDKFQTELPLPTRILLGTEYVVSNYGLLILAILIIIYAFFKFLYNKSPEFAYKFDQAILKVNIIGPIIKYSSLFRFTLVFSELIKAGLPVVDAIGVASSGVENKYLATRLHTLAYNIKKGLSLTAAFQDSAVFESMIIQIVSAGEASGSLPLMLSKATDYYRAQFQIRMDGISSSLEPILIAIMSVAVLLLALGIFMPMWGLASAAKG